MNLFKADLHIHTILSPCASLEMSPKVIVKTALQKGLDIIAITDHNSTRQCLGVTKEAENSSLKVFLGVEVNTKEEIHCLAYFENFELLNCFQEYIDQHLPDFKNNPNKFGYQIVVDENEHIIYEESKLLITGLDQNINQIELKVHELNGVFIPAHINKPKYSLTSQLGFIPQDLIADGYEVSNHTTKEAMRNQNKYLIGKSILQNSDAHIPEIIGSSYNILKMEEPTFNEFKMALHNLKGREIVQ